MAEEDIIHKIKKVVSDIERIRDGHKMDALICNEKCDMGKRSKDFHTNKASAYDFVIRKLKREFDLK